MVRKIGTNKAQVLHHLRMPHFTPRHTPADVRITPQEWKSNPEVSLKHDDLYARALECEHEQPVFDAEKNNSTPPNSPENPVQSDVSTEQMWNTQFTPRKPKPDMPITPRQWRPDPEVIIKHDDLYARAWKCEYEKPIFDIKNNNLVTPTSPEIAVRSAEVADEMTSTPGTIRKNSPEIIPQTNISYDGTDTDHYIGPDADTSVEQPDPTPTNPRSSKYDLRQNPKPNCIDDYRY